MKRLYRIEIVLVIFLIIVYTCKSKELEHDSHDKAKSSYGLGFSDSSIHPPNDTISPVSDTIGSRNSERLENLKKVYDDSINFWNDRCSRLSNQIDSMFWVTTKELKLSNKNARIIKTLIDSMNMLNKWEVDSWEHKFIEEHEPYHKLGFISNARIRDSILYFQNQLKKKNVKAKWDFKIKVYRLKGI